MPSPSPVERPAEPSASLPAGQARWAVWLALLVREWRHLMQFNRSDRRWQMPFCAALASGLPLLAGAAAGHLDYGLVASLGGMVFIYTPATALSHRMVLLMACGFGMCACYALGLLSHFLPGLEALMLTFIAIVVLMVCRFYALGPPGSLFFIMPAAVGAFTPLAPLQLPLYVGLMTLGCLLACLIAFFYSLHIVRVQPPQPVPTPPAPGFDFVVFDSVVMGSFVGLSLLLAQLLQMERAYWVPVSCLAVIQGASLRAVWTKQVHRIGGTAIGLLLAWALLRQPLGPWGVSLVLMLLAFVIESLVVRHYGLAAVFITPLTLLLTEAATLGSHSPDALLWARLLDTLLGSVVGLLGGVCLHNPRVRDSLMGRLRPRAVRDQLSNK